MTFDRNFWQQRVRERLRGWRERWQRAGVSSVYAFLSAATLWPVVEAFREGHIAALMALGSVLSGVGSNLLANQIQAWKDEADAARSLEAALPDNPALRAELDAVLAKLETLALAEAALSEADKAWFVETLRRELARWGSTLTYAGPRSIVVTGPVESSVLNTGDGNQIQQVRGPVGGDVLGPGAQKTEVHYHDGAPAAASQDLENAYLAWLIEQTNLLPLEGIDPAAANRAEEQVRLHAVYTALLTMSAEAHERLERGQVDPREVRRRSALEELNARPRLVLLGDPGSGKSTFVNFVALCLAGERLGHPEANLQTLTAPLPDDDGDDRKDRQPWDHGPLLPVRIVLRDFAARGLPETGEVTAEHLWDFLEAELQPASLHAVVPHLRRVFAQEGGLFLFDGLDEVPEAEERRERIVRFIHQVALAYPRARVLVTSRTYAYRHQDWALEGFAVAVLAPFSRGQIIRFVHRWYAHTAQLRRLNPQDAQGRARALVRAILHNERLYELAERPLLLTLMASLHAWRGGALPEKREQLYAEAVDLLLDRWERQRVVRDRHGREVIQPSLSEYLAVGKDDLRAFLNRLAYEAHATQPELRGTADIPEKALLDGLMKLAADKKDVRPGRLVEYLRDRAGLLVPRGVGVYTFPHRTFQEYLAACHLTDRAVEVGEERLEFPDNVAALARRDPDRWREVALLAGAKASRGTASSAWDLAEALCLHPVPQAAAPHPEDVWGAFLAGQVLVENVDLHRVSPRNRPKRDRVREWLAVILASNALPAVERAAAGDALAALGDPRFDPQRGYLPTRRWDPERHAWVAEPTLGFVRIPAGPFLMGSDPQKDKEAYDDEQPQHEVDLPYDYWMARYPVTVAQWWAFVKATGYDDIDKDALRDPDNRPVRWVTWYNAMAYCEWLNEVLKEISRQVSGDSGQVSGDSGQVSGDSEEARRFWEAIASGRYRVLLPSEAEWEKAARGTDGRIYPWGDEFDPDRANTEEAGIGTTTAVGAFPRGASPYGVLDLSGNVWEWTRSLWGKDWRKPDFGYPYDPTDGRENLEAPRDALRVVRGGSFNNNRRYVRAAVRFGDLPHGGGRFSGFRVVVVPESVVRGQRSAVRSG